MNRYVIIGCGNAGVNAAKKIRELDSNANITIITNEPHLPYCRCLLTYYIEDTINDDFLFEQGKTFLKKINCNYIYKLSVEEIVAEKNYIKLSDNKKIYYNKLLIANGGEPVKPSFSFADFASVFTLRKFIDAVKIKRAFSKNSTAIVEGGGLVSLKTLLALYKKGVNIKWIIKSSNILSYLLDKESANIVESFFSNKEEIEIIKNDSIIDAIIEKGNIVVKTANNRDLKGNGIIVGKGVESKIIPCTKNLDFNNGYKVNDYLETSIENIYAAGDCIIDNDISHNKKWKVPLWPIAGEEGVIAGINMVKGNTIQYRGAVPVNSFSVFNNNIIAGGKKKIEKLEEKDFFEKKFIKNNKKIYKKFIYNSQKNLKGYVLINDILNAGKYFREIYLSRGGTYNERNIN